jgi:hypothetical protein
MLRRTGFLLLLAVGASGCGPPAAPTNSSGPPPNLTRANFDKVREGMTLQEVEAILGPPGATVNLDVQRPDGSVVKEVQSASWFWARLSSPPDPQHPEGEARRIAVALKDGKVSSKEQVGLE